MVITPTPSKGGMQDTTFLPLEYLNGFLFGICLSRIHNVKTKELLIKYKKECYEVLAKHFLKIETPTTMKTPIAEAYAKF